MLAWVACSHQGFFLPRHVGSPGLARRFPPHVAPLDPCHPGVPGSIPNVFGLLRDDVTPATIASGGTGPGAELSPGHTCHRLHQGAAATSRAAVSSAGLVGQGSTLIRSFLRACAGTSRATRPPLPCSASASEGF